MPCDEPNGKQQETYTPSDALSRFAKCFFNISSHGKVKRKKADRLTENKVKPDLTAIIKHHKEKGYKGKNHTEGTVGEIIHSVPFSEKPEKALHGNITKAEEHPDADAKKENTYLI